MNTNKLPVFRTFGNALGFAVGNYFTVLRLAWLPFTLLFAANIALGSFIGIITVGRSIGNISIGKRLMDLFSVQELFFLQVVMWILQLLVVAAVAVSIHRVILFGDRRPGVYFSFRFGRTELVYAAMAFLWALMIVGIMLALLTPVLFLVAGGDLPGLFARVQEWAKDWPKHAPDVAGNLGAFAGLWFAYFIGWIIVLYVSLRLCVWPPSVVATNRLSPAEAWRLTNGNALRLFGLFFLTIMVFYVIVAVCVAVFAFQMHDQLAQLAPPDPAMKDPAAAQALMRQHMAELIDRLAPYWPVLWLVMLFVYSAVAGLSVALISYSYKALKGYDAREPIPDAA